MGGLRRRTFGLVAGALACVALALAAPLVAGAVGSFALLGNFVYEDVYGVFGDTALMSKTLDTVKDDYGNDVPVVQEDFVGPDGVLVSTVKVDSINVDDPRETEFSIGGRYSNYFVIYSTDKSEQGEGMSGLLSYDGKVALDPVYESLSFSDDESLIAVSFADGNGATVRLLDAETLQTVGEEKNYPGATRSTAHFYVVDGEETLYITVYEGTGVQQSMTTSVFSITEAGFGEDITDWATDPSQHGIQGVSSTGEEFSAYVNSDGDLVIECQGNSVTHPGPYYSYGYTVYGDYVVYTGPTGQEVFSYTGEQTTFFDGFYVDNVLTKDSSYQYLCMKETDGRYYLIDSNGVERPLQEGVQYSPVVFGNYLYGHTDSHELVVFDSDLNEVYRYDYSDLTTTDDSNVYLSMWDNGFLIGYSKVEDYTYVTYDVYLDDSFNLITEGWDVRVYRAANSAKLPDGSDAFVLWNGDDSDYGTVLGAGFKPVTIGGYELVVPGNAGQTTHYQDIWNSITRTNTDWYYARDPQTGKFGAVDASGGVALPFEYDSIVDCDGEGEGALILVRKGDTWSFLDTSQPVEPDPGPTDPGTAAGFMHRLYNPYTGEHFYTADEGEFEGLVAVGWRDEGRGWTSPEEGMPVYRLYNPYVTGGDHHYTPSAEERDSLVEAGWQYEGVGWLSATDSAGRPVSGAVPLYRQYNPFATTGTHNYTTSLEENDTLVAAGWRAEGVAWYGV